MMEPYGFRDEGSFVPDNLLAGEFPRETKDVTILADEVLSRGAVVGKVTASGKYVLCDADAEDGSEVPAGILVNATDATGADTKAAIYLTGTFNSAALTLGGTTVAADVEDALRALGIFLKSNQAA